VLLEDSADGPFQLQSACSPYACASREHKMGTLAFGRRPLQTATVACRMRPNRREQTGGYLMPKVYVGNLASSVTSRDLFTHFSRAGEVRGALAVSDKASGQCRGFGVVEMAEPSDVAVAYSLLNNTELNGQRILIEMEPAHKNGRARKRASEE
jgi:hypothetical protein